MNREDIIRMAQEAGWDDHHAQFDTRFQTFAALVADRVYAQYLEQPTPSQTGVISITVSEPVAYLCENAAGHRYFRWKKPSSVYKPIALYTKDRS